MNTKKLLAVAAVAAVLPVLAEETLTADPKKPFTTISEAAKAIGTKKPVEKNFFFKAALAAEGIPVRIQERRKNG